MLLNNNEEKKSVLLGTASLAVSALAVKIIGVLYKVPLSYMLGDEGLGYYNTAYTVYAFLYIAFASGLPKAVLMLISREEQSRDAIVGYLVKVVSLISFVISALFCAFSPLLSRLLGNGGAWASFVSISPCIFFVSVCGIFRGWFNYKLELVPISISQTAEAICKLIFGMIFAYIGLTLGLKSEYVSALTILGITIGSLFSVLYLKLLYNRKTRDKQRQNNDFDKRAVLKQMLLYSLPITLGAASLSFSYLLEMLLIYRYCKGIGLNEVEASAVFGNYSTLVQQMITLGISLITPLCVSGIAIMRKRYIESNLTDFYGRLRLLILLCVSVSAPLCMLYCIYPLETLDFIFKFEQAQRGCFYLMAMAPCLVFLSVQTALNTGLEAQGRLKACLVSQLTSAGIKTLCSLMLFAFCRIGIYSVIIGALVGDLFGAVLSCRFIGMGAYEILEIMLKPLVLSLI